MKYARSQDKNIRFNNYARKIREERDYDYYKWRIFVDEQDDVLDQIAQVRYLLHETFPDPARVSRNRESKFALESAGWGSFTVFITVKFKDGTEKETEYYLDLDKRWPESVRARRTRSKRLEQKVTVEHVLDKLYRLPSIEGMTDSEKTFYSQLGEALLVGQLEHLITQKNWGMGIMMAAAMLDYVGKIRLIWKYGDSVPSQNILQSKFAKTIDHLHRSGIIDESTQSKMARVEEIRDRLALDSLVYYSASAKIDIRTQRDFEKTINESIAIIRALLRAREKFIPSPLAEEEDYWNLQDKLDVPPSVPRELSPFAQAMLAVCLRYHKGFDNRAKASEIAEEITMDYPEVAEFYESKARISYATVFAADNGRGGGLVPAGLLKMRKEDSSRVYWT